MLSSNGFVVNTPYYELPCSISSKKRKADNPKKKQSGTLSETIVPKKPKNLFMMQNCYEFDNSNYSSSTTTKDENEQNEPELEALERSSSTSKDLHQQPKRSSQPHVSPLLVYYVFCFAFKKRDLK